MFEILFSCAYIIIICIWAFISKPLLSPGLNGISCITQEVSEYKVLLFKFSGYVPSCLPLQCIFC